MPRLGTVSQLTAAKVIPSLGVSDIERSVAFYQRFFGFEAADSYGNEGRMAWCWLRTRAADLMLQQLTADQQITLNPAIDQSWVLYIRPDDLEATHMELSKAGFPVSEIEATPYGTREFFVSDPDGYELWISGPSVNGDDDEDEEEEEPDDDEDEEDEDDEDEEEWKV